MKKLNFTDLCGDFQVSSHKGEYLGDIEEKLYANKWVWSQEKSIILTLEQLKQIVKFMEKLKES